MNLKRPARTSSTSSGVLTARSTRPSSWATLRRTANTTGEVNIEV